MRRACDAPYVLTVGTIEPRKDLPTIVDALRAAPRARDRDLELVVVGPPGWGEVAGLDRPGVRVLGAQPWRVVDALYRRAAACCIASRYEGFGLPALEALARGAPVVAADGSALDRGRRRRRRCCSRPATSTRCTGALERVARRRRAARGARDARAASAAATLTWEASAAAHVDAFRRAVGPAAAAAADS